MKIIYYKKGEDLFPGFLTEKGIIDINKSLKSTERKFSECPMNLDDLEELRIIQKRVLESNEELISEDELVIGPCVPRPSKIICVGLNYCNHAKESGMEPPEVPVLFTKYNNTLTNYEADVELGAVGVEFDYEVELGVVIGEKCKNVSKGDALKYVLGYCTSPFLQGSAI